jgi:hypothetical protein
VKRPEPLCTPLLNAIARAQSEGARVSRIRLSEQYLQGLLLEEEPRLMKSTNGSGSTEYFFDLHPVVISRISGWILETWARTSSPGHAHGNHA